MKKVYEKLILEAKKAINKGFYSTNVPHKRYGAAVLTKKGNIYSSGQYSSFNHITSIHAEMGAILCATMAEDYEIVALALAINSESKENPKSCGVCLQFIKEHYIRTGIDIDIIYICEDSVEINSISYLTKNFW
jgi:cytidine deaminase